MLYSMSKKREMPKMTTATFQLKALSAKNEWIILRLKREVESVWAPGRVLMSNQRLWATSTMSDHAKAQANWKTKNLRLAESQKKSAIATIILKFCQRSRGRSPQLPRINKREKKEAT